MLARGCPIVQGVGQDWLEEPDGGLAGETRNGLVLSHSLKHGTRPVAQRLPAWRLDVDDAADEAHPQVVAWESPGEFYHTEG